MIFAKLSIVLGQRGAGSKKWINLLMISSSGDYVDMETTGQDKNVEISLERQTARMLGSLLQEWGNLLKDPVGVIVREKVVLKEIFGVTPPRGTDWGSIELTLYQNWESLPAADLCFSEVDGDSPTIQLLERVSTKLTKIGEVLTYLTKPGA